MCSITDHVAEGILKYSLIPFAKTNDIEIKELINDLYEYYNSHKKNSQNNKIIIKKRGRPKGSKNKDKSEENKELHNEKTEKRKRGRPKGSNKKKNG